MKYAKDYSIYQSKIKSHYYWTASVYILRHRYTKTFTYTEIGYENAKKWIDEKRSMQSSVKMGG